MKIVKTFTLTHGPHAGKSCQLAIVAPKEAVPASLALQEQVLPKLESAASTSQFLLKKTAEDFLRLRDGVHGITAVALVEGRVIGQQLLKFHLEGEGVHVAMHPQKCGLTGSSAELCGAIVLEEYRGNHLTEELMTILEGEAQQKEVGYLTAEVHIQNPWSYGVSLRSGFFGINAVIDPDDQAPLIILAKPLRSRAQLSTLDHLKIAALDQTVPQLRAHLRGGYYPSALKPVFQGSSQPGGTVVLSKFQGMSVA